MQACQRPEQTVLFPRETTGAFPSALLSDNHFVSLAPRDAPGRVLRSFPSTKDPLCCRQNMLLRKIPPRPRAGANTLFLAVPGFALWAGGDTTHVTSRVGPPQPCHLMVECKQVTPSGVHTWAVNPAAAAQGLVTPRLLEGSESPSPTMEQFVVCVLILGTQSFLDA